MIKFFSLLTLPIMLFADVGVGSAAANKIATAFTTGTSAIGFATLPFIFVCLIGYFRAKSGHNAQSSSMIGTFGFAFFVHTISCIFFTLAIKMLDILGAISKESDYFSNKIFSIFWARSESAVYSLAGASGTMEDKGAYLQILVVQTAIDWAFIFLPIIAFVTGFAYAGHEFKENKVDFNLVSAFLWLVGAGVIGVLIYFAWAKIASIALFIPNGDDVISFTNNLYKEIFTK